MLQKPFANQTIYLSKIYFRLPSCMRSLLQAKIKEYILDQLLRTVLRKLPICSTINYI